MGPTTRKNPCCFWVNCSRPAGRFSSWSVGIFRGIKRSAMPIFPRSTYALPRNRTTSLKPYEKSISLRARKSFTSSGDRNSSRNEVVSSAESCGCLRSGTSSPETRSIGCRPTKRCRSDAPSWMVSSMRVERSSLLMAYHAN